jgi:hypothetical protein
MAEAAKGLKSPNFVWNPQRWPPSFMRDRRADAKAAEDFAVRVT